MANPFLDLTCITSCHHSATGTASDVSDQEISESFESVAARVQSANENLDVGQWVFEASTPIGEATLKDDSRLESMGQPTDQGEPLVPVEEIDELTAVEVVGLASAVVHQNLSLEQIDVVSHANVRVPLNLDDNATQVQNSGAEVTPSARLTAGESELALDVDLNEGGPLADAPVEQVGEEFAAGVIETVTTSDDAGTEPVENESDPVAQSEGAVGDFDSSRENAQSLPPQPGTRESDLATGRGEPNAVEPENAAVVSPAAETTDTANEQTVVASSAQVDPLPSGAQIASADSAVTSNSGQVVVEPVGQENPFGEASQKPQRTTEETRFADSDLKPTRSAGGEAEVMQSGEPEMTDDTPLQGDHLVSVDASSTAANHPAVDAVPNRNPVDSNDADEFDSEPDAELTSGEETSDVDLDQPVAANRELGQRAGDQSALADPDKEPQAGRTQNLAFDVAPSSVATASETVQTVAPELPDNSIVESALEPLTLDAFIEENASPTSLRETAKVVGDAMAMSLREDGQTVEIDLHPAELGKLKIQVTQVDQAIEAQIIATEFVTSELLNGHREQLMETLAELGFETSDVDITYQDQSKAEDEDRHQSAAFTYQSKSSPPAQTSRNVTSGDGINIVA